MSKHLVLLINSYAKYFLIYILILTGLHKRLVFNRQQNREILLGSTFTSLCSCCIFSSYLLIIQSQKKKKKNIRQTTRAQTPVSHAGRCRGTPAVQKEGWRLWNLSPQGPERRLLFISSALSIGRCHLWRRRRTLERICDGAVMWEREGVTCSALLSSAAPLIVNKPQSVHTWTFSLLPPLFSSLFSSLSSSDCIKNSLPQPFHVYQHPSKLPL